MEAGTAADTEEEAETLSLEEMVRTEMSRYRFSIFQYETMLNSLQRLLNQAENALCLVTKSSSGTDFLGLELSSESSFSGILFARSQTELLIMAPIEAVEEAEDVQATLLREYRHTAKVKAVDQRDHFAVLSVPLEELSDSERERLYVIPLGNSRVLHRGDTLLAIGAPAGQIYSTSYGTLSYHAHSAASLDGTADVLIADLSGEGQMGTFVLNMAGELVGWTERASGDNGPGYQHIVGISDQLRHLQALSNGAQVPYLGVQMQDVDEEMEAQGIPKGVFILGTEEQSPAHQAGIQAGDIVVRLEDTDIPSAAAFKKALGERASGDHVLVTVLRQRGEEYAELPFEAVLDAR